MGGACFTALLDGAAQLRRARRSERRLAARSRGRPRRLHRRLHARRRHAAANTMFARPGTNSALRAATRNNPRVHPCPRCKQPNRLTPADVRHGYQCDACADAEEGC